jgi:ComF family protein
MVDVLPSPLSVDVIMPVPLHPQRLREREFNQSLLLADRLGRHLNLPVVSANLVRRVPSPPQTSLSRKERLRSLRNAFGVRNPERISGKRVLLIDDVFTTGSTVNECARALRKAGSDDVSVLTLARTVDTSTVPDRILAHRARRGLELVKG